MLGPLFLAAIAVLFCLSLAVFAYGALCSVFAANASAALAAFLGVLAVFAGVLVGSLSISSASVRSVSSVIAAIIQWISPFYYAALSFRSTQAGSAVGSLGGMALLLVLAAMLLFASQGLLRRKGVRA